MFKIEEYRKNIKGKREERTYKLVELRVLEDEEAPKIEGHAAVFNELSEDLGGFREKISPGAFKKTIQEADVRALFNHDPNFVLARSKNGTLKMEEDEKGLKVTIDPVRAQWANDLMESIRRGDIDQMSFGFRVIIDEWDQQENQEAIRTLKEVSLFDVSPVTFPAYPQTDVGVRAEPGTVEEVLEKRSQGLTLTSQDVKILEERRDILDGLINQYKEKPYDYSIIAKNKLRLAELQK